MSFRSALFSVLLLVQTTAIGQAQTPRDTMWVAQLDQLLEAVTLSNPDLRAMRLNTEALFLKSPQVSALPDPMLGVTYLPSPLYTARGTQQWQLKAEQSIPFPGKLGLKEDIADMNAIIDSLGTDAVENRLLLQVKLDYFEIYRLQQIEELIYEFQDKLRDFESVAVTQYEVGRGIQQAIVKAQLERNTLSTRLSNLTWQRRSSIESLSRLVNRPVALLDLINVDVFADQRPVFDIEKLLWVAIKNRPESAALDSSMVRADLSIDLAEKMYYPDFSVGATYFGISESDIPANSDGKDGFAIGLSVKIPLQRGRLNARREEEKVNRARIETGFESLVLGFRTRIADLVSRVYEDESQLELYTSTLIPQAETTLEATMSAYTTGRTDFLNLLDAERVLFMVHTGYEDIYARRLKTLAMLEQELGVNSLSDDLYN